jgi:uncharacterized membrane protein YjfL (UPF0719 family)
MVMAFLTIRTSMPVGVVCIIGALAAAWFFLLFGVANLIRPEVSEAYLNQNTAMCLFLCGLGIGALLAAVAVFRGILLNYRTASSVVGT